MPRLLLPPPADPAALPLLPQVSYLVVYGSLPTGDQLGRWTEAVMRHSGAAGRGRGALPLPQPRRVLGQAFCRLTAAHTLAAPSRPAAALPVAVEQTIAALPHDAHPMGTILTGLSALSTLHPEQARPAWPGAARGWGLAPAAAGCAVVGCRRRLLL